ncbi:MAG: YfhO family protein [Ferruginibacter sp.]|nr:YfhO family protein [Ferruginibacter sp.]
MFKKIISNPFFLFPLLTCIFFWPISLQLFTFKNDALTYYYPVRTLISDALNNHELPLWTPFINMGYPLHADMQSGAWNPIIWIIGLLTNYNLAAFHYELLFYLALGGIGFYLLGRDYGWNKYTALIIGAAYEFSGPIIDSTQFTTCISSAGYIPFIFLFFRRVLHHQQPPINALLMAFFLYLLFTGGYPAFFIITIYLLLSFFLAAFFSSAHKIQFLKKLLLPAGLIAGVFILLSLPAIISFVHHLQFIDRGKNQSLNFVLENPMTPSCMFSLISPFSTTAASPFFNTNILMRSIYMGLVPLVFLIYAMSNRSLRNNKSVRFFLITALILFGLAWGGHFFLRQLAYYILPLMNTFRHPALFRFFGVIFFLLAAGFSINEWGKKNKPNDLLAKIIPVTGIIILLTGAFIIFFPADPLLPANYSLSGLKTLIAQLGFQQRFLIQLPFVIATLCFFYFIVYKKKSLFYMLLLSITDLFFATQLNIPITVIGARTFAATELHINRNPVKFPLPGNTTIEQNALHSIDTTNTIGSVLPFEKRIGRNDYYITPGNLSLQDSFYESAIREQVLKNRLVYFADTVLSAGNMVNTKLLTTRSFAIFTPGVIYVNGPASKKDSITIKKLSANTIECSAEASNPRLLILLQNVYPGWKVFIDGKEGHIFTVNTSFIGVNIAPGKHIVVFKYHPTLIIYAWYISLFTLLLTGIFLLRNIFQHSSLSTEHHQRNTEGQSG